MLAGQPWDLVDESVSQCVGYALEHAGVDERLDVAGSDGTVADAACGRLHFDERFEPEHAARSVTDHLDGDPLGRGHLGDPRGDLVGAHRARRRVTRNIDPHTHRGTT